MYHRPMHWIDERLAEDKALDNRNHKITSEAPQIFNDMWSYVAGDIEHARNKSLPIFVDGSPQKHTVGLTDLVSTIPGTREFYFTLSQDKHSIVVHGYVQITFRLLECRDGIVRPTDKHGNPVEYKDAARRILDPFLFPHLQGRKPDEGTKDLSPEEQDAWRRMQRNTP